MFYKKLPGNVSDDSQLDLEKLLNGKELEHLLQLLAAKKSKQDGKNHEVHKQ